MRTWGYDCDAVEEKRLLTKQDELPISVNLRRFPKRKQVVSEAGYKIHSHPSLELSFVLRGRATLHTRNAGDHEISAGALICMPSGMEHGLAETFEETLILSAFYPAYERPKGSLEHGLWASVPGKFMLIRQDEVDFVRPWGEKGAVVEKRLLHKEHGLGIGFVLRFIPGVKELAERGQTELLHERGYRLHTHPCLEVGYPVTGHFKGFLVGHGEEDIAEDAVLVSVEAGVKHGARIPITNSVLALFHVPPFAREPVVVEKENGPEEG